MHQWKQGHFQKSVLFNAEGASRGCSPSQNLCSAVSSPMVLQSWCHETNLTCAHTSFLKQSTFKELEVGRTTKKCKRFHGLELSSCNTYLQIDKELKWFYFYSHNILNTLYADIYSAFWCLSASREFEYGILNFT